MKKKLLLVILMVTLLIGATAVFASADTVSNHCEACGKTVTWEPLNPKQGSSLIAGHYHFYLTQSYTGAQTSQFILDANVKVCLDLNGKTFATNGRSLLAKSGSEFNVMDSVGGGVVNGSTGGNNPGSGTVGINNGGVFNLYSGTLRFTPKTGNYYGTGRGAAAGVEGGGVMNIYGGTVEGGELVMSTYSGVVNSTTNGCGGAIYVYGSGALNLYGGTITSGSVPEGGKGPCVYLASATAKLTLSGDARVEHIYAEKTGGITVSGAYTGKARLFYGSTVTPANQLKIGTSNNADLSGADLMCINGNGWKPVVSGTELRLATFTPTGAYHWCTHCEDYVNWTAMASSLEKIKQAGNYHIYLSQKYETAGQLIPENNAQICLDLYGQTFESSRRAIHVTKGTVNLMDSVGGGKVIGHTGTNNPDAGASAVKAGSVMNMYGGTIEFIQVNTAYGTGRGGAMILEGTLNLYGGTIKGGDMVVSTYYNVTYNGCGGAIYMFGGSTLNAMGGKILSGSVPEGKYGPCIFVEKNTAKVNLSGDVQVEDIFFVTASADNFKIIGDYTGSAALNYLAAVTPDETTVLGSCGDWDISGATMTCGKKEILARDGKLYCSTFDLDTVAGIYTDTGAVGYESLEAALAAYTQGVIQLCKPVTENVTVDGTVYLDLNGYSVDGTVTVTGTLYGMDSQTDDYDVSDGVYGKLTVVTQGNGKVLGMPVTNEQDNYLLLDESGKLSFHRVTLQIYGIALRPQVAGLYYNSRFLADQKAAADIEAFGIALSVEEIPTAQKLGDFTAFENFQGGPQGNGDRAGTLLTGILKEDNGYLENLRNFHMPVYGVAYARTADGCLLGLPVSCNLAAVIEEVDGMVDELNSKQTYGLVNMCDRFDDVIHTENYVNLAKEQEKQSGEYLRILMVGNSHGLDATQMLNEVFKAEAPGKKVLIGRLYYSGCTMPMHAQHATNNEKIYEYSKIDTTSGSSAWVMMQNSSILDALEDETWDIVVMQQQNEQNGIASSWNATAFKTVINYICEYQAVKPKLLWQMLWVNPDDYTRYIGTNAPLAHPNADRYQTSYETNFPGADGKYDHTVLYNKIVSLTQQKLVNSNDFLGQQYFDGIIPAATTVEYALDVLGRPQYEMFRDWTHLSDYGRLMVAYQWYAEIMGLESISQVNVSSIPSVLHKVKSTYPADLKITDAMKQDIIKSVNWTLEHPYELPEEKAEAPSYTAYFDEDPGEDDTLRLLMIGNSGCYYYADELYAMLAGTGIKAEVWHVYYSGCNVKQHWTWLNTDAANYKLVSYSSAGKKVYESYTLEKCLLAGNWDVITLQQAFWPEMTVETAADATLSYASYLIAYVRQRFPNADLKWHQTWAYQVGFSPLTEDPATVEAVRKVLSVEKQTAFYQVINTTCETVCRENDLDYIPVANAWQLARKNPAVGDNLCARLGSNNDKGDNLHDGDIGGGQYLNACVWFETLTGQSCIGNTFRPSYELSEEKIAALQAAAHQAVTEMKAK